MSVVSAAKELVLSDILFAPKFITLSSSGLKAIGERRIYAVMQINSDQYGQAFTAMNIIDGKISRIKSHYVLCCQYSEEDGIVWGVDGDYAYYDSKTLRAQRMTGPAAFLGDKKIFAWKGCITYDKGKFFEYLTKKEKLEAAFNLDEF